jgi:hypothetical protein
MKQKKLIESKDGRVCHIICKKKKKLSDIILCGLTEVTTLCGPAGQSTHI